MSAGGRIHQLYSKVAHSRTCYKLADLDGRGGSEEKVDAPGEQEGVTARGRGRNFMPAARFENAGQRWAGGEQFVCEAQMGAQWVGDQKEGGPHGLKYRTLRGVKR
jgi:hypothetical protein